MVKTRAYCTSHAQACALTACKLEVWQLIDKIIKFRFNDLSRALLAITAQEQHLVINTVTKNDSGLQPTIKNNSVIQARKLLTNCVGLVMKTLCIN